MSLTEKQLEIVESYIKSQWCDGETLDDLTIFLNEGYLDLVVHRLVGAGAIDPEMSYCPETEKLCMKLIEGYTFEQDAKDAKDAEDCMRSVNPEVFFNPETNEIKFVADYQLIDTEYLISEGYISKGKWNDYELNNPDFE